MTNPSLHGALARATDHATQFLAGLETRSVAATAGPDQLRARLALPLRDAGCPADQVIEDLIQATAGGHLGSAGGRFFGWVVGGALPSALAADWLTSAWDNNAVTYACAPAAAVAEEVAGGWLKEILGLPTEASFAITTGCQMAHVACLAAARNAVLARAGWDVELDGLIGAPRIRVLANDQYHGSVSRALRLLGLGSRALEPLATDDTGRLAEATLRAALAAHDGPTILVLNAADLHLGACDDFARLIPLARAAGAWVHVDGAFGLWARASRRHRHLVDGVELADSWATDAHKWLNTPKDGGLAFVRDVAAHRAAFAVNAGYMLSDGMVRDPVDFTPEWTRRARAYPIYAALRELGRDGVADLVDRCCDHALALARGLAALPGVQLVAEPTLNQAVVRFPDPRPEANDADHDRSCDAMIAAINATGEAFFSGTVFRGRRGMRISVVNWRTTAADIDRTIAAVNRVLAG